MTIEKRDDLFHITLAWFQDEERQLHKRIGALLVKLFVEVEKEAFDRRLSSTMPILRKELDSKNFEEVKDSPAALASMHACDSLSSVLYLSLCLCH